jgi:hypothetical protein
MGDLLTTEQQAAVDRAVEGCNVRVRAVPGAGKTHTLIALAPRLESIGRKVLQLTYSRALLDEWRGKRGNQTGLRKPHSFHSFACVLNRYLDDPGELPKEDDPLRRMLDHPPPTLSADWVADVILVDEMQDVCPLFASFLQWYAKACGRTFQMIFVGQEDQIVYECLQGDKQADLQFFLQGDAFAKMLATPEWVECRFTMSFRLTPAHADAVNGVFGTSIVGCNTTNVNRKPRLNVCNMFDTNAVANEIQRLIKEYGTVQLVAPSWKKGSRSPAMKIRNRLSHMGVKFADSDDGMDVKKNKIVCYTCHSVKGTESECTIVLGADDFSSWMCRPAIFVSYTRAREQLVIFQHHKQKTWILEGAPCEYDERGFEVNVMVPYSPNKRSVPAARFITVTDLLRSDSVLTQLMEGTSWVTEQAPDKALDVADTIDFNDHSENLPHLLGIIIPFWYAVRDHATAPRFDHIFDPIVITNKNKGEQAIEEVRYAMTKNGEKFPEFERSLFANSDTVLVQVIQTHLRKHGHEDYASRVISQKEYDAKFPSGLRHTLGRLRKASPTEWEPADVARAALASDAFDGSHCTLHQVPYYDWVLESEEVAACCHSHMREVCDDDTARFEAPVQYAFETARTYKQSLYPVSGLHGRVDCVVGNTIVEFKFAEQLTTSYRLQLFLYMCMWLMEHPNEGGVTGILLNVRTGERLRMRLTDMERASRVLQRAVALHFGGDKEEE